MRERLTLQGSFLYLTLTSQECRDLLILVPRAYKAPIPGGQRDAFCHGLVLDHDAAIDLLLLVEGLADETGRKVHLQTPEGFTVDIISPPCPVLAAA